MNSTRVRTKQIVGKKNLNLVQAIFTKEKNFLIIFTRWYGTGFFLALKDLKPLG